MTTLVKEQQTFNAFNYVKNALLREFCLQGCKDSFDVEIKNYYKNNYVFGYLNRHNALKVADVKQIEEVDIKTGDIKRKYIISVKDFNVNATAMSKENKEFYIFHV